MGQGFTGRRIVLVSATAVSLLVAAVLSTATPGLAEIRAGIRLTALTSTIFFVAAFSASALYRFRPTPASRW